MRIIPFFNYQGLYEPQIEAYDTLFRSIVARGAYIQQSDLAQFEANLVRYLGVNHAMGVANATDGLILLWKAIGLQPGDEVIFPSHTMVASPASVFHAGGTPVPVDCGADHLIDPAAAEAAITPRTRAIMPVQLNGRTADMERIQNIAERHGLLIVEDAAQGLGSTFDGKHAGSFGMGAAFSFYPAKILGCMGDGGAVTTNDNEVARKVNLLRDHGRGPDGDVEMWGLNSRLDNLQAAILDYQFATYSKTIARRRAIAAQYDQMLGDLPELTLPPAPDSDPRHFDVYQNYEVEGDRRDDLRAYLREHGVGTIIQWGGKAVHQFQRLGFTAHLPATDRVFQRCVLLPMNLTLSDDDVIYVCETIRRFYLG